MSSKARYSLEPAAEAIREVAVPLSGVDAFPDPTPIVRLIGSADVVGCGEPTHGDKESIRLKHALIRAIVGTANRTLIAWERGVGNIRYLASFLDEDRGIPHDSRGLIYPWVYREVDDLFRWVRDANRDRPGAVSLCGVDMDGPPPPVVLDELIDAVGTGGASPLDSIRRAVIESRRSPDDEGRYQAVLAELDNLSSAAQILSSSDRLLLAATTQWARFRLLELAERQASTSNEGSAAAELRDKCIAENLIEQRRIYKPDVVLLTAHNGHVSCRAPMAGWNLARAPDLDYVSVGVAFGGGSFNAGTARDGGGFHPELKVFDSEPPPDGSLEALLEHVGFSSFVFDLRPFRGTDHPLAHDMTCREVGLAGGAPQFDLHGPPAEMYDVLIWFDSVTPAAILRKNGDFW